MAVLSGFYLWFQYLTEPNSEQARQPRRGGSLSVVPWQLPQKDSIEVALSISYAMGPIDVIAIAWAVL